MKILALLCVFVASATSQSQSAHFQVRGFQDQNQQQSPGFGSSGRAINQDSPSSSQNTFVSSQRQQSSNQNQGSGFTPSSRSGSRFQNSARGQQVLTEAQRLRLNAQTNRFRTSSQQQTNQERPSSVQTQSQDRPASIQRTQTQSRPSSVQTQSQARPASIQRTQAQSRPAPVQRTQSQQSTSSAQRPTSQQTQKQPEKPKSVSTQSAAKTSSSSSAAADTAAAGRLLDLPDAELCKNRPKQWQFNGNNYYFSWDQNDIDPVTNEPRKVDWLMARNACRKQCMDSIGIETEAENNMVIKFMTDRKVRYIWTSGRLCDFTGCAQRKDLHPISVLGWFWSDTNTKTAPTNKIPPGWIDQPWSAKGHIGGPQPDNAEFDINRTAESCLAVLNDIYKDGIKWHDIACYHKKPYICEDSKLLLDYIKATNPGIVL